MAILLTGRTNSYIQFITVLIIFVLILAVTAWTTRWIANYQKNQNCNENMQIIETMRISNNKFIQIIRIGQKYMVIAVCKDTVTSLGEIPADQINGMPNVQEFHFKDLLSKAMKKPDEGNINCKDKQSDDEV